MITKIIQEELIQKAKKYVEKGESFVIVSHVSPDGDWALHWDFIIF